MGDIMIKAITLSTLRIEAIKNQYAYALKMIGKMEIGRVALFLKEIESRNISEISFHGLKPNSYKSDEDIFISVDWDKHDELIRHGKTHVDTDDTFEDEAAPQTLIECLFFTENCKKKGLKIEMRVTYSKLITNNSSARMQLNSKLGLRSTTPNEQIEYSTGSSYRSKTQIHSIQEMSISRYSN